MSVAAEKTKTKSWKLLSRQAKTFTLSLSPHPKKVYLQTFYFRVLHFLELVWVGFGQIESSWVWVELHWIQLSCAESSWVILSPVESGWVVLSPVESTWVWLSSIESGWVWLSWVELSQVESNWLGLSHVELACKRSKGQIPQSRSPTIEALASLQAEVIESSSFSGWGHMRKLFLYWKLTATVFYEQSEPTVCTKR